MGLRGVEYVQQFVLTWLVVVYLWNSSLCAGCLVSFSFFACLPTALMIAIRAEVLVSTVTNSQLRYFGTSCFFLFSFFFFSTMEFSLFPFLQILNKCELGKGLTRKKVLS